MLPSEMEYEMGSIRKLYIATMSKSSNIEFLVQESKFRNKKIKKMMRKIFLLMKMKKKRLMKIH